MPPASLSALPSAAALTQVWRVDELAVRAPVAASIRTALRSPVVYENQVTRKFVPSVATSPLLPGTAVILGSVRSVRGGGSQAVADDSMGGCVDGRTCRRRRGRDGQWRR